MNNISLLLGTRKGAFILASNRDRREWKLSEPIFLGHIVYHFLADPKDERRMVMAAKTGHLGPTVFVCEDGGSSWSEATSPPAFAKAGEGEAGRAVESVFWLSPSPDQPGVWYAGTAPPGLFRSTDHGRTFEPVEGFNDNAMYEKWVACGATPGGQMVHSVLIDPRDNRHMYLAISVGGVLETTDGGGSWSPLNSGLEADFLPDQEADFGHDPHCMVFHADSPDLLYQQNHCGIYRMHRRDGRWTRVGKNMPEEVGDIGFPIVVHPARPETIWVFPMDGTTVWPRTSPGGKPCVYVSADGGDSWRRQDRGLPEANAYFTVKRQAMACDGQDTPGLYFGTSQGEVWGSTDEGESWTCLVRHLPEIYSLCVVEKRL